MANPKSLLDPDVNQCPYPFYEELRKERPITFMPEIRGYFVSSYALGKQVLTDKRFRKEPVLKDGSKFVPPNKKAIEILLRDEEIGVPCYVLSESDGSRHLQVRKIMEPFFGNRGASSWEPSIQSCAETVIDEIGSAETCEFVSQFSSPYTIRIMCDMIGMPSSTYKEMKAYAAAAMAYRAYVLSDDEAVAVAETLVKMHGVVREMLREREKNPKNDLLSLILSAKVDDKPFTEREKVYMVEELLLAGNDTTADSINSGMMHLATNPALQDTLRKDPQQTRGFVEEALRMLTSIQSAHRVAEEDVEVGGVLVKAGEKVYIGTGSANRDDAQFKCPVSFDHHRPDANRHIAFGGGLHMCLGAIVTRIEQRVAYDTWLKRFSEIELMQPLESIKYNKTWVTRSPVAIPLRLRRA